MPTMLVWTKSAGPWIERSTWLSAAKLTMARGRCRSSNRATVFAVGDIAAHEDVPRLALEARQVGEVARVGELVQVDDRGSDSAAIHSSTKFEPMNPAPPVTRIGLSAMHYSMHKERFGVG